MNNFSIDSLNIKQKRSLIAELKESIKHDITLTKANRLSIKKAKEIEKKQKIQEQIKAAELKLARLTAKLS
jgi:hypothetical protein